jgi:hypothetical protein
MRNTDRSVTIKNRGPEPARGVGVRSGAGVVVNGIVTVERLSMGITDVVFRNSVVGTRDSFRTVVGILEGNPRSIKMSLLAADREFSTFTENVLVAVLEEVWNVITARPSELVVTRA